MAVDTLCPLDFSVRNAIGATNAPITAVSARIVLNGNEDGYWLKCQICQGRLALVPRYEVRLCSREK